MSNQEFVKALCASVACVLLASGFLFATRAQATIPLQNQCSTTYDPQRSYCEPVVLTPWQYQADPFFGMPIQGPFPTEAAAIASIPPLFTPPNQFWCTEVFDHITHDFDAILYVNGIDYVHGHIAYYNATGYTNYTPDCSQSWQSGARIMQTREVKCPVVAGQQFTLVYEAGNAQTPYCAMPWTAAHKKTDCDLRKGNPCDVMSGSKTQTETDYVAAGDFPIRFVRTYNSDFTLQNYFTLGGRERFNPLGIGWSATFFHNVIFRSSGDQAAVVANRPDGSRKVFRLSGSIFVADDDVSDRLIKLVDGGGATTGWKYITAAEDTEMYDAGGRLISIVNRAGITQTVAYASPASFYPSSVTDSFGRQIVFGYDGGSYPKLTTITLPGSSGQIAYAYDAKDNLSSVTYADNKSRIYLYELTIYFGINLLTGITDENNIRFATFDYESSSSGRVIRTEHAGVVDKYTFAYNFDGSRTVIDPLNKERTYGTAVIQGARRFASSSDVCPGCGEWKTTGYDADGNVQSRTDFNNNETRYGYDTARNLETSRTEAYGTPKARTITTQWHASYRLPTQIDEPNRRTTFTHDASGDVLTRTVTDLSVTPNVTRTWTYTYNSFGQVLTANGPRTDITDLSTYVYYNCSTGNQCGQLNTVTDAKGRITTYNTYNAHGQPLTITDPNSVVTTLAYDARQRLISRQVGAETTTFNYWPTGLLKKVTLPDLSYLLYTYDNAHRLTRIDDGDGNHIDYTLDPMGNRTGENAYDPTNFLARTHTRVINSLNQIWKEVNAAGTANVTTVFGYDNNGNQTTINAPLSRTTTNAYDELNRLKQITDSASGITQFGYDASDNLTSVTDPRTKVTSYTYTGFGDLKQQVSPDTGTTNITYDSGGNLKTSTDARSKTATYSYDALNRVTQVAYGDQTITYGYDAGTNGIGRLTSASDSSHSMSWSYDGLGRVTNKSQTLGSVTKSVSYGYTSGNLTSMTTPSGQSVVYGYNSNHQITSVQVNGTYVLSNVLYDPFGPVRGWTWGNGTLAVRTYDTDGKVSQVDSAGLNTYGYDDAFRITGITDTTNGALSWTYGYDLLDRLTSGSKTGLSQTFTYDANGNRLTQGGTSSTTYTISSTSNRLSSTSGALVRTYTYDAAGNVLTYSNLTYTYNNRGRMKTSKVGSTTTTYVYNATRAAGEEVRRMQRGRCSIGTTRRGTCSASTAPPVRWCRRRCGWATSRLRRCGPARRSRSSTSTRIT